jgi:hypothetical protein
MPVVPRRRETLRWLRVHLGSDRLIVTPPIEDPDNNIHLSRGELVVLTTDDPSPANFRVKILADAPWTPPEDPDFHVIASGGRLIAPGPVLEPPFLPRPTPDTLPRKPAKRRKEGPIWAEIIIPHMVAVIADRKGQKLPSLGAACREAAKSMETEGAKKWLKARKAQPLRPSAIRDGIKNRHSEWFVSGKKAKKGSV